MENTLEDFIKVKVILDDMFGFGAGVTLHFNPWEDSKDLIELQTHYKIFIGWNADGSARASCYNLGKDWFSVSHENLTEAIIECAYRIAMLKS